MSTKPTNSKRNTRKDAGLKASIFGALMDMEEQRKAEDVEYAQKKKALLKKKQQLAEKKMEAERVGGSKVNEKETSFIKKKLGESKPEGLLLSVSGKLGDLPSAVMEEPSLETQEMALLEAEKESLSKKMKENLPTTQTEVSLEKSNQNEVKEIPGAPKMKDILVEVTSKSEVEKEKRPIEMQELPTDFSKQAAKLRRSESRLITRRSLSEEESKKRSNLLQSSKEAREARKIKFKTLEMSFIYACSHGDLPTVRSLLQKKPRLIDYKTWFNQRYTGLHYAAKGGYIDIARYLLRKGANLNLQTAGYTPLHLASLCNQEKLVEILVNEYNADVTVEDKTGRTYDFYLTGSGHDKSRSTATESSSSPSNNQQFSRMGSIRKVLTGFF